MRLTKEEKHDIYKKVLVLFIGILIYFIFSRFDGLMGNFKYVLSISRPILLGLSLAFIINILLNGVEDLMEKIFRLKNKTLVRTVSLLLSYVLFFGLFTFVISTVIPQFIQTILSLIDQLPKMITEQIKLLSQVDWLRPHILKLVKYIDNIKTQEFANFAIEFIYGNAGSAVSGTVGVISVFFSSFFEAFLVFIFSIYILSRKEVMGKNSKRILYAFLPETSADLVLKIGRITFKNFYNFFTGQFIEAILLAVIVFIGMTILRLPFSLMIAVMAGFLNLIPYFGSIISGIIGSLIIFAVSPFQALVFLIFILIVQQFDGNVMYPRLVGGKIGVPSFWIIVSVTLGGAIYGILGMIVFVPIVSTIYMLVMEYTDEKLKEKVIDLENK